MSKRSILIVEDEAIVAEDLASKVRQLGHEVAGITATGEEAIELARRLRPTLVLMDIRLAGAMDGIAAAQVIYHECKVPVLFLTAHSDTGTVELAKKAGALGYILKPFGERDLRIQIEMAFFKHDAEQRLLESQERLAGINEILQAALISKTEEELGHICLVIAEKITQSTFGFIGKLNQSGLEIIALSRPDMEACSFFPSNRPCWQPECLKMYDLYDQVFVDGKSLFVNTAVNHPDGIILPENLPPLTSILCVPLLHDGGVVGLLAVGNCEGEYTQAKQDALESLTPSIVEAFLRKEAEEKLQNSTTELQKANSKLLDSRRASINLMQDAILARQQAEAMNVELQSEVTERKQAEEALRALNEELERRVERRTLELQKTQKEYMHMEKLSAIGKLSASIAHEFNNPLQGIMSVLIGLKSRAVLDEEDKVLLDEAIEECTRIRDLIRSLQEFNRPSSGIKTLFNVHKALDSLILLHKSDFKKKRISMVLDYAEHLPQIEVVSDQIKQVFLNLLTNAADACHLPGGVITINTWQEDEERVAVSIKDTGIGIAPSDMESIFQPFYTTKPEVKGTGLGLSISHGIIKNHQGEFRVESQPGEGSSFTVLLPIKAVDDPSPSM
jgi:signal transduction histidine kinase/AmiR/NasT family two-component response regulator